MKEWQAWKLQAHSDYEIAELIFSKDDVQTYCHTVAKYQQSVEEHIKGVYAVLEERGAIVSDSRPIDRGHTLDKTLKQLRLLLSSTKRQEIGVGENLRQLSSEHFIAEAAELCRLAPSYPKKGDPFLKNTEYPFNEESDKSWNAPCATGVFSKDETMRFRIAAKHFDQETNRFLKALRVTKQG